METRKASQSRINAENYAEIAKAFAASHGSAVALALADGFHDGVAIRERIPQWGAWRAYFRERRIPVAFMDAMATAGKSFTVPAEWPHEFDGEATVQSDHQAGQAFRRNHRPERRDIGDAAHRKAVVAAAKTRMPGPTKYPTWTPSQQAAE